jgi:nicotinate-nucleotide adenylyltransferase
MTERLAIFGGTFNPIHRGHIAVARAALDELRLARLLLVPSAVPPHKAADDLAPGPDRLAMCRLAAADDPRLEVSDLELRAPPPSYTVNTLRELRRARPDAELVLLIGADMLRDFHLWYRAAEIVRLARLVTMPRPGVEVGPLAELRALLGPEAVAGLLADVLHTPLVDVSSTEIRRRARAGEPLDDLVPPPVARYVREHRLYT